MGERRFTWWTHIRGHLSEIGTACGDLAYTLWAMLFGRRTHWNCVRWRGSTWRVDSRRKPDA